MIEAKDRSETYTERYVAFVDILGFSEIVTRFSGDTYTTEREALIAALQLIGQREIDQKYGDDFRFQQFSDSIIMSDKANAVGLFNLLASISSLGVQLLRNKLLIRGGLAKGLLYHKDQLVFGPAFLRAYALETSIAKYPRVVLSAEVLKDARRALMDESVRSAIEVLDFVPELKKLIRLDDDGPAFVDIFSEVIRDREIAPMEAAEIAKSIGLLLRQSMHDPRHYEKLKWLAVYWNSTAGKETNHPVSLNREDWLASSD